MTNFTKGFIFNDKWYNLKWRRYKSRNMYISEPFYTQDNCYFIVMSYNTIIGFTSEVDKRFITWGHSEYSCTTSKQITQFCNENHYAIKKVSKYSNNDLKMLACYLELYDDIVE